MAVPFWEEGLLHTALLLALMGFPSSLSDVLKPWREGVVGAPFRA